MFIKLLDKDVSNMIAAGEVVERPASAIKELCENSIDAGASIVTVEVRGGGVKFMRVTDNGCGIHPEDVAFAFMRHATSKISEAKDLDSIYTLGFRGEALASIASVANVEIYTRTAEFEQGVKCCANFGNIENTEETPGFIGTSIKIENLFYNTPARMKFLKKDLTESGYIEEVVRKISLAHPEVSFRFISDGKEKLFTSGDGELSNVVFSIYGREVAAQMLPITYSDGAIKITGLVSNPVYNKKTKNMQMFYVNNRPVVSRMLSNSLEEACKGLIPVGMHPLGIIKISIPAQTVDVNVHPAKLEVKFSDEGKIYKALYWAVKNVNGVPLIPKIETSDYFNQVSIQGKTAVNKLPANKVDFGIGLRQEEIPYDSKKEKQPKTSVMDRFRQNISENTTETAQMTNIVNEKQEKNIEYTQIGVELTKEIEYNIIGQIFNTYILVEKGQELLMIDQHAAHEHIVYGRLLKRYKEGNITTQLLLTPEVITIGPVEKACAVENIAFFDDIGFEIEDFGKNDIMVRGVPEVIAIGEIENAVTELVAFVMDNKQTAASEIKEIALHMVACRAAIKAGKKMSVLEMNDLIKQLFEIQKIITCPHGRPAWIVVDKHFIEKQFKRIK